MCRAVEQTINLDAWLHLDHHKSISELMEGPVLTESEVWKVGSGTSGSLNTDYSPLVNNTDESLSKASENTIIQEEKSDPAEDLSTQTAERCVHQAENQEITILVTNHDCTLEDEEEEKVEELEIFSSPAEPEAVSSGQGGERVEEESLDGSIIVVNMIEVSQVQKTSVINNASTEPDTTIEDEHGDPGNCSNKGSNTPQKSSSTQSEDVDDVVKKETLALTRSPGRTQHVQTQVSLEVMYQSVATSPMTPPEGTTSFLFPSTFGKLANKCIPENINTKDVEMRSVATAPMTPIILTAPEVIPEPEPRIGVAPEDLPEPVQEVSWDEKGMTWEVYGAVVEVAVLGTAIQKHLEKQVKKQKKQPSDLPALIDVPSSVDLTEISTPMPSSPPPTSDSGEHVPAKAQSEETIVQSGRRRRNHFRQWFRSIRRPSCCSRPRQDEDN